MTPAQRAKRWYRKHKAQATAWYKKNCEKQKEYARLRWKRLREQVIKHLGGKCAHCGIKDHRVLHVDHKYGGGTQERKKMGGSAQFKIYKLVLKDKTGRFQLLCANCNRIKRLEQKEDRKYHDS